MAIIAVDGTGNLITLKTYTDGGEHVRAVQVDGTVTIQDGGNTITVDGEVSIDDSTPVEVNVVDSVDATQDTHDDLNLNANIQVNDTDVANGNPVPISDADGSLTVDGEVGLITGSSVIGKVATGYSIDKVQTTLIDADTQISNGTHTAPQSVTPSISGTGNILSLTFYSTGGDILIPAGILYILDSSPTLVDSNTAISASDKPNIIGKIKLAASDWDVDSEGAIAYRNIKIPFNVSTFYVTWKHLDSEFNSATEDNEVLGVIFMCQVNV